MISSPLNKQTVDRFLLVIDAPPALRHLKTKNAREQKLLNVNSMQYTINGSIIPSINVNYQVDRFGGQSFAISQHSKSAPEPITVKFIIDNEFNNYWFIYKWLDFISDDQHGIYDAKNVGQIVRGMPGIGYQTNLTIYALDEYQKAQTIKFVYTNAFPTFLGGVEWSYQSDGLVTCSFSFMYSQFYADLICDTSFDTVNDPVVDNSTQNCD
jgi:hypothetical protein